MSAHLTLSSLTGLIRPTSGDPLWRTQRDNRYPDDQYPSINNLAAAIKTLPTPTATVPSQTIEFTGSIGRYQVTFVVRHNSERKPPSWYWGIESGRRLSRGPEGLEEAND